MSDNKRNGWKGKERADLNLAKTINLLINIWAANGVGGGFGPVRSI